MSILPEGWPSQYEGWLREAKPLLQVGQFDEAFGSYPWVRFTSTPLALPRKPLSEMTVVAISSGGLTTPEQRPFDSSNCLGDSSIRWIPGTGPGARWRVDHAHYDPVAAREDYNTILPLDLLQGLAADGMIAATAPEHISFMGYQPDPRPFLTTSAKEVASRFAKDGVDAALLVPI